VVSSPHFKAGIVGLVAGKLTERFYRPTVVIEEGESESRGSARSIAELDISAALDEVSHLLVRHGGHKRAAGFTLVNRRLSEFSSALQEVAARSLNQYNELRPTLFIDSLVSCEALNWGLQEQFARLEPTGQENPPPLLLSRRLRIRETRTVGNGKHLRLVVDGGPQTPVLDAVAFQQGEWCAQVPEGAYIDLVYQLEANEWQGRRRLQLNVQDWQISETSG
jgi:single-stranded-DNA-specific exonuclease